MKIALSAAAALLVATVVDAQVECGGPVPNKITKTTEDGLESLDICCNDDNTWCRVPGRNVDCRELRDFGVDPVISRTEFKVDCPTGVAYQGTYQWNDR